MGLKPGRDGVLKLTNLTVQEEETGGFHGYSLLLGHETEVRFHRFEPSDVPNSKATILELREKYGERKFTEQWQKKKKSVLFGSVFEPKTESTLFSTIA